MKVTNTKSGNPYHDDSTGQFTSANGGSDSSTALASIFKKSEEKPTMESPTRQPKFLKRITLKSQYYVENFHGIMQRLKTFSEEDGTYDFFSGKRVCLSDGYMVTFHQNEPDENGECKSHFGRYTEDEYDKMALDFAINNNVAGVFIGSYGGPEISFWVKSREQAKELAIKHNQKSFWDNALSKEIENPFYDKTKNPMEED